MLNLFQYINNLLFNKKQNMTHKDQCSDSLNGFVLNRWISFYDKENCQIVNEHCNRQHIAEDVDLLSKFLMLFVPKKQYKKINYIKKVKCTEENSKDIICKIMQVGTRDAEMICKVVKPEDLKSFLKIYQAS